jgi:SET domain-containing protein
VSPPTEIVISLLKMTKQDLLNELSQNTFVMLKPSTVEGIGVFAIQDIPQGCREMFAKENKEMVEWISLSKQEVNQLPKHSKLLVENYCLYDDEQYFVPADGFKKMDVSLFINHSDTPNIMSINDGEFFEAIRDIKTGEELFLDYGEIVDGE